MVRVSISGLGDLGSILGWVIPKTQKMILDASLLNTQHYKVWIKGKWNNSGKSVAPFPTRRCSSYWKGSLWFVLDYDLPTYLYIAVMEYPTHPSQSCGLTISVNIYRESMALYLTLLYGLVAYSLSVLLYLSCNKTLFLLLQICWLFLPTQIHPCLTVSLLKTQHIYIYIYIIIDVSWKICWLVILFNGISTLLGY